MPAIFPEYENIDKTLDASLIRSTDVITNILANIEIHELAEPDESFHAPQHPWRVALNILDAEVQIILNIKDTMVLGRAEAISSDFSALNLSPFGAFEYGVSRHHAILMLQDKLLLIRDNMSMNGTYLNRKRLKPDTNYIVHSGDYVNLGQMSLSIVLLFNPYA